MDEYTADAFVNRDDTVSSGHGEGLTQDISPGRLRDRQQDASIAQHQRMDSGAALSFQDRLFSKLLQQVIPEGDAEDGPEPVEGRSPRQAKKPAFSLPLMTNNFRRFNARIGIVFVFQGRVVRLLSWRRPTQTLSFLFVYSFVCLDPYLLIILPLATVLLYVMVPAFAARHPPPPSSTSTSPYYSYQGPALAPPRTIKPASETSKDFFRNMRDLQNSMADYSNLHDSMVSTFSPPTNFSDEKLSSTLFLILSVITALLFLTAHLLPWRLIFLVGGNAAVISIHPSVQDFLQRLAPGAPGKPSKETDKAVDTSADTIDFLGFSVPTSLSSLRSLLDSVADITLDSYPEEREVEIFELQYRPLSPYSASSEWEHFLFSPTPYDPLSPSRIAGDRPRGCRFFEDVQPPSGWAWKSKKWELDLDCREWVVDRMVTGVGFEVPGNSVEGSVASEEVGGWVWDLPPDSQSQEEAEAVSSMASSGLTESRGLSKSDQRGKDKGAGRDWEEAAVSSHGMGEWRRRRWVRIVQRVSVPTVENDKDVDTDRD